MKKLFVLLMFFCLSHFACAQTVNLEKTDNYLRCIENGNLGMGSIAIFRKGESVYSRNFGHQSPGCTDQEQKEIPYQIGSITKLLTAIIANQLSQSDQLDLNQTIDRYYPDLINGDKITINHLLSHTSGLKDYVTKNDTLFYWLTQPVSKSDIYNEIIRQGSLFEPGDSVKYSNSAYFLLAGILEKRCGKPYSEILKEKIVEPLGLVNTKSNSSNQIIANQSYRLNTNGNWEPIKEFYFPNVIGVGEVVSTVFDLNTILQALLSNQLITSQTLEQMKQSNHRVFGKGLMKFQFHDKTFYGHNGETYGTHSIALYCPEDSTSIAICINGGVISLNRVLIDVLSILYNYQYTVPEGSFRTPYKVDSETLKKYEGLYKLENPSLEIKLFCEDGNLLAQATHQPSFILIGVAENRFGNFGVGVEMIFDLEKKLLTLKQQGVEFVLKKEE